MPESSGLRNFGRCMILSTTEQGGLGEKLGEEVGPWKMALGSLGLWRTSGKEPEGRIFQVLKEVRVWWPGGRWQEGQHRGDPESWQPRTRPCSVDQGARGQGSTSGLNCS